MDPSMEDEPPAGGESVAGAGPAGEASPDGSHAEPRPPWLEELRRGVAYYDKDGTVLGLEEFTQKRFAGPEDYWRVAFTELVDGTHVSTVWLGLDHNFTGAGPPLIFETMVFASDDYGLDQECWRWPTEAAALAGHDQVVAKIAEALDRLAAAMADIDAGRVDLSKKPRP